jgi:hypothetical protein
MTAAPADAPLARRMWRTLEPYHGFVYFAPEATARYDRLGAPAATHYFGSRSAAMGRPTAEVVAATFFNFAPWRVHAAIPAAWNAAPPEAWIAARLEAADAVLRRVLGTTIDAPEMAQAADLARTAALSAAGQCAGRPLAAAHAALVWPGEPHLVLWHAITVLREFRGDGHVALLTAAGLSGIEALVVHAATGDVPAAVLQSSRGWSDDDWTAAVAGLAKRGVVDSDGRFTEAGRVDREALEAATDVLAAEPWETLGADAGARLRQLVRPWSKAIVDAGAIGFQVRP